MREITHHKVNGLNESIRIVVGDEPGPGGACHDYFIKVMETGSGLAGGEEIFTTPIRFQKGPIKEAGVNGLSNDALLTIVIDRLEGFQSGDYACEENEVALIASRNALYMLQKRTRERMERGVEGTYEK